MICFTGHVIRSISNPDLLHTATPNDTVYLYALESIKRASLFVYVVLASQGTVTGLYIPAANHATGIPTTKTLPFAVKEGTGSALAYVDNVESMTSLLNHLLWIPPPPMTDVVLALGSSQNMTSVSIFTMPLLEATVE